MLDFIEPMECLSASKLPEGPGWIWEIKLDGYRAEAVKSDGDLRLYSRNRKSFKTKFPLIYEGLSDLPNNTILDGEIVALDESGRPNFNLLQNFRSAAKQIHYFVFDVLAHKGQDLTSLPLSERREILRTLKFGSPLVRVSEQFETSPSEMLSAVRQQKLEGIIGKRKDSRYEIGKRTGSWIKHRINQGQDLVIGGYVPGPHGLDSIIVGYYRQKDFVYVARVRNGFVPASRRQVYAKLKPLEILKCPFVNLPEEHRSRWGEGLTEEDMKKCVWVRPQLVARVEYLEWTESDHLRHTKFAGLSEDKDTQSVVKEQP
jgi:DNA ligase D-like protein (predicted ligase)